MRARQATTALVLGVALGVASAPAPARAVVRDPGPAPTPHADERAVAETAQLLGPRFRRYETEHFVLLSDAGVSWSRSRAALLERTRDQFFRATRRLNLPTRSHDTKLLCVLFDDHDRYAAFAHAQDGLDAAWVGGYFATATNRVVFYDDRSDPRLLRALERLEEAEADGPRAGAGARRQPDDDGAIKAHAAAQRRQLLEQADLVSEAKTIHEAVHLLAYNTGVQRADRDYPFWLNEGLATCFETDDPDAAFGPDQPSPARDRHLDELARGGELTPIADLITMISAPADDADRADAMYHTSYALFRYLYRHERANLGAYIMDFAREPPGPMAPDRQRVLFQRRFGDPNSIQRRLAAELNEAT